MKENCGLGSFCTYTLFLPQGVEIELIFALRRAVSEVQAIFQNYHIWAWNWPSFRSCIYTLSTPWGRNWAYFRSTDSGFWDTGQVSKLPYLGIKLCQSSRSCTYTLFLPRGRIYFHSTGSGFWDTDWFSKLPYFDMKPALWPKFQKLHIYTLTTPRGRNGTYFRSMGSSFPRNGLIFAIFGHEIWPLAKIAEVAYLHSFYTRGPKLTLVSLYGLRFPEVAYIHSFFLPKGRNWAYFCSIFAVSEIQADF